MKIRVSDEEFIKFASTHTIKEMVEHFDYKESYIKLKLFKLKCPYLKRKLGKPKGSYLDKFGQDVIAEYVSTHTIREAAAHFKVSIGMMYSYVKGNKIPHYSKKYQNATKNDMIRFLAEKFTYKQVGEMFGISKQRVEQIKKKAVADD